MPFIQKKPTPSNDVAGVWWGSGRRDCFSTHHPCFTEPQYGKDEELCENLESELAPSLPTNRKPLNVSGSAYVAGSVIRGRVGTQIQLFFGTCVPSAKVNGDMTFRGTATEDRVRAQEVCSCWRCVLQLLLSVKGFSRAVSFRKLSRYGISWF